MIRHSPISPSAAERWINCPGSVKLTAFVAPDEDGSITEYQRIGTKAHEIAAAVISSPGTEVWEFAGEGVTQEILDIVDIYVNECLSIKKASPGGTEYVEYQITATGLHPNAFGTVDWAYVAGDRLFIRDLKTGAGRIVEADNNPQLLFYAAMLVRKHPHVTSCDMGIVQPRVLGKQVKQFVLPADKVREWEQNVLLPAVSRVERSSSFAAGEWCRFCPVRFACPRLGTMAKAAVDLLPSGMQQATVNLLSEYYKYIPILKTFISAVEAEVMRRWMRGEPVPGTKLVAKRSERTWAPEAEAELELLLGREAYKVELLSPAQVENKFGSLGKELTSRLARSRSGGPTVALESDPRPALDPINLSDFKWSHHDTSRSE